MIRYNKNMTLEFKLRLSQKNYELRNQPPTVFTKNKRLKKVQYSDRDRLFLQQQRERINSLLEVNDPIINHNNITIVGYIRKKIPLEKGICPISLEEIGENTLYQMCYCKNCFKKESIDEWIQSKPTCPMCRRKWRNTIIYKNC